MINPEELPEDWKLRRLADICLTKTGGTPSRKNPNYFTGAIPWVKSGELEDGIITKTEESITDQAVAESNAKVFPKGTLLMAMYGATVGKLGRLSMDAATNQAICAFFPKSELDSDYLWHYLRAIRGKLLHSSFGAAQPNISQTLIKALDVPAPPLAEQRRLVARIETLTSRLEQAREARQVALAEVDTLRQALWDSVFAEVPEELWQPIGAHAKIQGGYAFKSGWFTTSGIRLLRNQNVYHGTLEWSDTVYLPPDRRHEFPTYEMNVGDVVISMDRPLISTGLKAARIRAEDLPCLLLQRVGRFQFKPGLLPDYLFHFLSSQAFMMHISGDGRSSAVPHISAKQIEAIRIPTPSSKEQHRIVERLDALSAKQTELHRLQKETEAELAAFTPALLAKAFRGEL